jgi:phage-related tail protein
MAESRRRISESEVQQAQVVLAAQDMVDRMQKMMEEISEMQFKDLPALTDSIKNDPTLGPNVATQFQTQASQSLSTLLTSVQAGKTQMEAAQGVLTGQAPVAPGVDTGAELDAVDASADLGTDAGADIDADISVDANMPADDEDDLDDGAALGRERR